MIVGEIIYGFKFESNPYCNYFSTMDDYLNKEGEIITIGNNACVVKFYDGKVYAYPRERCSIQLDKIKRLPKTDIKELLERIKNI